MAVEKRCLLYRGALINDLGMLFNKLRKFKKVEYKPRRKHYVAQCTDCKNIQYSVSITRLQCNKCKSRHTIRLSRKIVVAVTFDDLLKKLRVILNEKGNKNYVQGRRWKRR